jgi:hypothetical protein
LSLLCPLTPRKGEPEATIGLGANQIKQAMLKFYWLLIVALWLSACSVLEVRRDLDGFIPDYTDPVMVINGVVTPSEVSIDVAPVVDLTELDRNGERPDPSVGCDAVLM